MIYTAAMLNKNYGEQITQSIWTCVSSDDTLLGR